MKKHALAALMLLGATAHAETITGRFTFLDRGLDKRPIRRANVEILRQSPGTLHWNIAATTLTDENGNINATVTFVPGAKYSVRVYAENAGATVWKRDSHGEKFYGNAGERNAGVSASSVLNFDYDDPYLFDANHFNIADAILRGHDYANSRRAPGETDVLGAVPVFPILWGNTYFDPLTNGLRIQDGFAQDDFTILHEYGHFLEDHISGFFEWAAPHSGCSTHSGPAITRASYAWMEAFSSYFAQAVALQFPGALTTDPAVTASGTFSATQLESPAARCTSPSTPLWEIELFVGGALWDIIDPFSTAEPGDRLCQSPENPIDRKVFLVFDKLNMGWTNPSLQDFVNGWIAEGFDLPSLISAFGGTATGLSLPPFMRRYDASPAANLAYYKPSTGMWMINGGENGVSQQWGEAGGSDVPLPRDYDGDGFTDLLVYRPNGGTWFLISSRTGRMSGTQWGGVPFDVPVPGDYDGDNEVDYAIYRPGSGQWFVHVDDCRTNPLQPVVFNFGSTIGTPLVADWNNDNQDDPIMYVPSTKTFHVRSAQNGFVIKQITMDTGGTPFVGNFDNTGSLDFATYSAGYWHIKNGDTGAIILNTTHGGMWDTPVPADYNGDGIMELMVFTLNSQWISYPWKRSTFYPTFGEPGVIPVPAP